LSGGNESRKEWNAKHVVIARAENGTEYQVVNTASEREAKPSSKVRLQHELISNCWAKLVFFDCEYRQIFI
jgi:hypothetical protein